jgi:hypothetical protein
MVCSLVDSYNMFEESVAFIFRVEERNCLLPQKMEEAGSYDMLVNLYQTTQSHITENSNLT